MFYVAIRKIKVARFMDHGVDKKPGLTELWKIVKKSHTSSWLRQKSMTLDDLDISCGNCFVFFASSFMSWFSAHFRLFASSVAFKCVCCRGLQTPLPINQNNV